MPHGAPTAASRTLHANFDVISDVPDRIGFQGLDGRRAQHGTRAAIVRCTMQGADEPVTAEPSFVHFRVDMGADIIERIPALSGAAKQDIAHADLHGTHLAFGQLGGGDRTLKSDFAHVVIRLSWTPTVAV